MQNDSIETLLLRHYGSTAPTPEGLDERLRASLRRESAEMAAQKRAVATWRERRISRRRAMQLVFTGSAGLGALGAGLEALLSSGASVNSRNLHTPAYS